MEILIPVAISIVASLITGAVAAMSTTKSLGVHIEYLKDHCQTNSTDIRIVADKLQNHKH
tara:strand:- start:182 stop:361 length:180 start_codon:yes stop_codon:yes gene_type:complete